MDATPGQALGCADHLPFFCAIRAGPRLAWRARVVLRVFHRDAQVFWGQTWRMCRWRWPPSRPPLRNAIRSGAGGRLKIHGQSRVGSPGDADPSSGRNGPDPSPGPHPAKQSLCDGLAAAGPAAPAPVTPHPVRFACGRVAAACSAGTRRHRHFLSAPCACGARWRVPVPAGPSP